MPLKRCRTSGFFDYSSLVVSGVCRVLRDARRNLPHHCPDPLPIERGFSHRSEVPYLGSSGKVSSHATP